MLLCFVKQMSSYELRIIDWSSDVCSSDLTIIAVLTIVISLILLIVVASAGLSMNRAAQIMEERTIEREIDRLVTRTLNEQKSVALWDEAVQRIRSGDEAWLDNEVGAYLTGSYGHDRRSEEHTSALQSLMRIWYAVLCLKKK